MQNHTQMPALAGTKTEENLRNAFSAECQVAVKYAGYAAVARREGYEEIGRVFDETAHNEKEHAEIWFRFLGGYGNTEKMLESAAEGEHWEWTSMYRDFAATAEEEGFLLIAALFRRIAEVEEDHERRYSAYLRKLRDGKMFTSDRDTTRWICLNCGYVVIAREAPRVCPACSHDQGYFREVPPQTEGATLTEELPLTARS